MSDLIKVELRDIWEWEPKEKFDAIAFTECWALIPNIKDMILHTSKWLKPQGKLFIITTLEDNKSAFREFVKPRIRYALGQMNDFGRPTTYAEMEEYLKLNFVNNKYTIDLCD
jgi:predicted TPR repeat methyltransferase